MSHSAVIVSSTDMEVPRLGERPWLHRTHREYEHGANNHRSLLLPHADPPVPGAALNGKGGDAKGWDGKMLGIGSLSLAAMLLPAVTEEGKGFDKP